MAAASPSSPKSNEIVAPLGVWAIVTDLAFSPSAENLSAVATKAMSAAWMDPEFETDFPTRYANSPALIMAPDCTVTLPLTPLNVKLDVSSSIPLPLTAAATRPWTLTFAPSPNRMPLGFKIQTAPEESKAPQISERLPEASLLIKRPFSIDTCADSPMLNPSDHEMMVLASEPMVSFAPSYLRPVESLAPRGRASAAGLAKASGCAAKNAAAARRTAAQRPRTNRFARCSAVRARRRPGAQRNVSKRRLKKTRGFFMAGKSVF